MILTNNKPGSQPLSPMKPAVRNIAQTVTACVVSGAGLAVLALLAPPPLSPRQMVAAQIVRGEPIKPSTTSNAPTSGSIAPSRSAVGNIAANPPATPAQKPK